VWQLQLDDGLDAKESCFFLPLPAAAERRRGAARVAASWRRVAHRRQTQFVFEFGFFLRRKVKVVGPIFALNCARFHTTKLYRFKRKKK
jgi:hypothetical protein